MIIEVQLGADSRFLKSTIPAWLRVSRTLALKAFKYVYTNQKTKGSF